MITPSFQKILFTLSLLYLVCACRPRTEEPTPNNKLVFPTAFYPNKTMDNKFVGKGEHIKTISLKLYDRHGQEVYSSTDWEEISTTGWDGEVNGEPSEGGVYTWLVKGYFDDGSHLTTLQGKKTGQVIIIK